jgi:hypothetical protein
VPKRFELVTTGAPQFHIYGAQQPVRQKLRFLQTTSIQPGGAQTTVVPTSAVGQTVQVQSGGAGQKITVATINASVTSQASTSQSESSSSETSTQASPSTGVTVQVGPQRFIKQGIVSAAQGIGQNTNQKLVMVQRSGELPQQFKTTPLQLTAQTQLAYAPTANLKIQQPSGSTSGQQITTLIKTSAASGITTVAGTSQIGMKLSPVRAGLTQNQTMRQVAIPQTMTMGIQRKAAPKAVTRIAQVSKSGLILQQKDEGKYTIQEVRPMKQGIFLTGNATGVGNVIPVSVSQASGARGETLQVKLTCFILLTFTKI